MRLYRGLKEPYRPENVGADRLSGTDFTDCPHTALQFAQGRRGVVLVVNVPDDGSCRASEELWQNKAAKRFMIWGCFDGHIIAAIPANDLRSQVRAKGVASPVTLPPAVERLVSPPHDPCTLSAQDRYYPNSDTASTALPKEARPMHPHRIHVVGYAYKDWHLATREDPADDKHTPRERKLTLDSALVPIDGGAAEIPVALSGIVPRFSNAQFYVTSTFRMLPPATHGSVRLHVKEHISPDVLSDLPPGVIAHPQRWVSTGIWKFPLATPSSATWSVSGTESPEPIRVTVVDPIPTGTGGLSIAPATFVVVFYRHDIELPQSLRAENAFVITSPEELVAAGRLPSTLTWQNLLAALADAVEPFRPATVLAWISTHR